MELIWHFLTTLYHLILVNLNAHAGVAFDKSYLAILNAMSEINTFSN